MLRFYSRIRFKFINISFILFILLILPYILIKIILYLSIITLLSANILVVPLVFNYKYFRFPVTKYIIARLIKLKIYSPNRELWKLNYYHTFLLIGVIFIFTFIDRDRYISIMSGLFTGSVVTAIFVYFSFSYEKFMFKNDLLELYKENNLLLKNFSLALFRLKNDICPNNKDNILQDISLLNSSWQNVLYTLDKTKKRVMSYDDSSFVSLDAYDRIISLGSMNKRLKEKFINILSLSINKMLVNLLNNTILTCNSVSSLNTYILTIISYSNELLHAYEKIKLENKQICANSSLFPTPSLLLDLIEEIDLKIVSATNTFNECFVHLNNYRAI